MSLTWYEGVSDDGPLRDRTYRSGTTINVNLDGRPNRLRGSGLTQPGAREAVQRNASTSRRSSARQQAIA